MVIQDYQYFHFQTKYILTCPSYDHLQGAHVCDRIFIYGVMTYILARPQTHPYIADDWSFMRLLWWSIIEN